MRVVTLTHI